MNKTTKSYSKFLVDIFRVGVKKLDKVATVNVLMIFALALFALIDSLGNSLMATVYSFFNFWTELFSHQSVPTVVDSTPFWQYAIFLLVGFVSCLLIVKWRRENKLW